MIRKYIIVADDSFKGFDEGIEELERKWGAEEIESCEDCVSRKAAIEAVKQAIYNHDSAIMRLADLPSVTPSNTPQRDNSALERVEDCISRSKVLEGKVTHQSCDGVEIINSYAVPIEYIKQLPSVTPQPRTGRWIRFKEFEHGYYHIKCSECGQYWSVDGHAKAFKYCFNCGSKMEVGE